MEIKHWRGFPGQRVEIARTDPWRAMREKMPATAALVDFAREVAGREAVDAMIRRGMRGEADCFHARENGQEVGTPWTWGPGITADRIGHRRRTDNEGGGQSD